MNGEFRFLMYRSAEEDVAVNAVIRDETVWLTQKTMAELFGVQPPAINKHLKNIFNEGELDEGVVVSKMEITTLHGAMPEKTQAREVQFYNLDAIISVGYHYAIMGRTAAEIIHAEADRHKENMGLTTWKNAPDGRILKSDVTVAKNYLGEKQIRQLERTVSGYFDYIEDLIERENTFTMEEFAASVNEFLAFRRYDVLHDKGKISRGTADAKAEEEYAAFNKTQKITSDFDRAVRRMLKEGKRP